MTDPSFPGLHIRPARGWVNDPNGTCRIDGRYHVFFQHNPGSHTHSDIHWGHVSSPDLLHWTEEPVALRPRAGAVDAAGCWSGCVVDDDGVPTAVYTGVPRHAGDAGVVLARSDRSLREWRQGDRLEVGTPADPPGIEVRDPFVFTEGGRRYAVQGAGVTTGSPRLLLYGVDDLTSWTELGPLLTADDPVAMDVATANIWECPNLFQIDDQWVLVLSLWRSVDGRYELSGVRYLLGDLVPVGSGGPEAPAGLRFLADSGGLVDHGPTFYATQVVTQDDRVLLWAWAWEGAGRGLDEIEAAGWAGVLTFPRELYLDEGVLASRPAAELTGLRAAPIAWEPETPFRARSFEVDATGPVRLRMTAAGVGDLVAATEGPARILVDGSIIEVFAGGTATTSRAYPTADTGWTIEGSPTDVRVWRLALPSAD